MIEYVAETSHAKTLFSTHYHELTTLDQALPSLKMFTSLLMNIKVNLYSCIKSKMVQLTIVMVFVAKLADLPEKLLAEHK